MDEASTSKEKHTMHAAAHRAQMKDMLDEKKREEEGKEIRHQRVVAKMQKKIDFLEDELLRERQLSRSLTDALLKGEFSLQFQKRNRWGYLSKSYSQTIMQALEKPSS